MQLIDRGETKGMPRRIVFSGKRKVILNIWNISILPPSQTVSVIARKLGRKPPEVVAKNTLFSAGGDTI